MSSLRERLAAKRRPTSSLRLRIDTPPESKLEDLRAAQVADRLARMRHGDTADPELVRARKALAKAEKTVEAYYETLVLRAMAPDEFEALIASHRPTDEQRKADGEAQWNKDTFPPALLSYCVEGDMTEADWNEFWHSDRLSTAERNQLLSAALEVNIRLADDTVPKGWTATRS